MKQEESKILQGLGKNPGFKVPENYFDDFNKRMLEALPEIEIKEEQEPVQTVKVNPGWWQRVRPVLYAAASLVGIAVLVAVFTGYGGSNLSGGSIAGNGDEKGTKQELLETKKANQHYDQYDYRDSVMSKEAKH